MTVTHLTSHCPFYCSKIRCYINQIDTLGANTSDEGKDGELGLFGRKGTGGLNGPVIQGTYITGMAGIYHHPWTSILGGKFIAKWPCNKANHWLSIATVKYQSRSSNGEEGNGTNSEGLKAPEAQLTEREFEDIKKKGLKEYKKFHTKRKAHPARAPFVLPFQE